MGCYFKFGRRNGYSLLPDIRLLHTGVPRYGDTNPPTSFKIKPVTLISLSETILPSTVFELPERATGEVVLWKLSKRQRGSHEVLF